MPTFAHKTVSWVLNNNTVVLLYKNLYTGVLTIRIDYRNIKLYLIKTFPSRVFFAIFRFQFASRHQKAVLNIRTAVSNNNARLVTF